ncbi:MAG: asparagine synthase (glutamine-hydrolyzing) [Moritella sp.]|uniref:asparagine synthase (glutamine-hydrolyzing) n=1 Tax=Moritella sp. TaxID=78556 RepID=UPI001DE4F361|nr:asparagine synthase (glutamine-hydrolyzing) [Moritella sp.]NQZ51640.1 asparagine synthase (glutamine-hydrolyzing) [Moritella sp.]
MCGIFGYFDTEKKTVSHSKLQAMGEIIEHRGPDGLGLFHDLKNGVALGNQRLAIIDVEHGEQPFYSALKDIVVVQNGEIFNHVELAEDLKNDGFEFDTTCDTEVILRLYEREGIAGISKLNGMFAIAIYDLRIEALYLIRDRIGEKPLYYSEENGRIVFSSEIKSILEVVDTTAVNAEAVNQFFSFNYVPPPLTMFDNIKHVMPGRYLKITAERIDDQCWWDLADVVSEVKAETEWISDINSILDKSVKIRLRADVPFGAFLSGGVDSSSVVGLMSKHLKEPVKTFCIGFHEKDFDESEYALEAATRFKTKHVLEKVDTNLIDLWPLATYHSDQPHGDVSFLPTYRVAALAAKEVKMVLTGDGADELFAGYDKYLHFFTEENKCLTDHDFRRVYLDNISLFSLEERRKLFSFDYIEKIETLDVMNVLEPLYNKSASMDRINQALYIDVMMLLPGNNLVKPDRMGMAVSLENRSPFLDYRMVELAFSMPGDMKLKNGITKYIYKKAVVPLIGKKLSYRKKQMFTVPIGNWFKDELAVMCKDLLFSDKVVARKIFNYNYIKSLYEEHCKGIQNNTRQIRALMAIEIWFRIFIDKTTVLKESKMDKKYE